MTRSDRSRGARSAAVAYDGSPPRRAADDSARFGDRSGRDLHGGRCLDDGADGQGHLGGRLPWPDYLEAPDLALQLKSMVKSRHKTILQTDRHFGSLRLSAEGADGAPLTIRPQTITRKKQSLRGFAGSAQLVSLYILLSDSRQPDHPIVLIINVVFGATFDDALHRYAYCFRA
jgi:hypothetical protein